MRSKSIRLHQRLAPVLILLPLLLVGCEQWGQSGQLGTPQRSIKKSLTRHRCIKMKLRALVPPLLVVVTALIVLVRDR
jgi:hypothetical protein